MTRMRDCRPVGRLLFLGVGSADLEGAVFELARVDLLMYERARVRAPAIWVVFVEETSASVVLEMRERTERRISYSIRAKARYLFASLGVSLLDLSPVVPLISMSPSVLDALGGRG